MDEPHALAEQFERNRTRLRSVAYRMLGSMGEAEDAVQEAWFRLSRADAAEVGNLAGWLTTVVARICLDVLRSRSSHREEPLDAEGAPEPIADAAADPERATVLADSLGVALLVLLEALAPAERVAFVLHDMFDMPFDQIAPIVGKSPVAVRQLASRARRRVRGASASGDANPVRRRQIVNAFLEAARGGSLEGLLALLDPHAVVRADAGAQRFGAQPETRGAEAIASVFARRASGALPALVGGQPGLAWAPSGKLRVAMRFTITGGRVAAIDLIADPRLHRQLNVTLLAE